MRRSAAVLVALCGCLFQQHPDFIEGAEGSTSTMGTTAGTATSATASTTLGSETTSDGGSSSTGVTECDPCPWWDETWGWRLRLTAKTASVDDPIDDAPVLVVLTSDRINYPDLQGAGADVRFVSTDGSEVYPHEIEAWDDGGTSLLWVNVPRLGGGNDRSFYMYYGNPDAPDTQQPARLWADFGGVWHLETMNDSTGNGGNLTNMGSSAFESVVGQGRRFESPEAFLSTPGNPDLHILGDLTVSFWGRALMLTDVIDGNAVVSYGGASERPEMNYSYIVNFTPKSDIAFGWEFDMGEDHTILGDLPESAANNLWHYVVVSRDTAEQRVSFYVDGQPVGERLEYKTLPTGGDQAMLFISGLAEDPPGAFGIVGALDEIRVAPRSRSAAWAVVQFRSMEDQLLDFGVVEAQP